MRSVKYIVCIIVIYKILKIIIMQKFKLLVVLTIISTIAFGQVAPNKYWVKFTDKNNSPYSIDNPEEFLSQRAIDRRTKQGITIKENDIPVNPQYIQGVKDAGATILTVSKWFNSVTVYAADQSVVAAIEALPYVLSVGKGSGKRPVKESVLPEKPFFANETYGGIPSQDMYKSSGSVNTYDYGAAYNQIHMLNGEPLHNNGYDGAGMVIAVLDAGFLNADNLSVFDSLWATNRILGTKDFVNPQNPEIFTAHYHGSMVLSTMGGNLPGELVGTAPQASYYLLRTEDGATEYLIEELNWVSGAEYADSVGADVLNTSLGYTEFDDPAQNHTYADMDGNTTPITIGADIAASKGMIPVNSAGNSGGSSWYYIGAPADGDSVFSIGAVDAGGNLASFSSRGPTADGRVKPNVMAQGAGSTVIDPWTGAVSSGSGTSFSSPITAGMVACLWQANPEKTNVEIMQAIQQSASQYNNPDDDYGYGIPDYWQANNLLTVLNPKQKPAYSVEIFPNPFIGELTVNVIDEDVLINSVEILDIAGKTVYTYELSGSKRGRSISITGLDELPAGFYLLKTTVNSSVVTTKILKK
jgi:hypothetical protein